MEMHQRVTVHDPGSPLHGRAGEYLFGDVGEDLAAVRLDGADAEVAVRLSALEPERHEPDPDILAVSLTDHLSEEWLARLVQSIYLFAPGVRERVEGRIA